MPSRPFTLDTGFDTNPVLPPSRETPSVDPTAGLTGAQIIEQGIDKDILGAGFRMENDVLNFVDLMSRPVYEADDSFQLETRLKEAGLWEKHRWNFIGVQSEREFLDKAQRIAQEDKDRELLASAGPAGFVAMLAAGIASPVNLLPFVGPGVRGAKAIAVGAGYGLAGGLAQEIPLQLNQETRTVEESIFSVGMSTVIGGVLGGAVGYLNRPLRQIADDMAYSTVEPTIPTSTAPSSVGAMAAPPRVSAGRMKSALGQEDEFLSQTNPVSRVLSQTTSKVGNWMMAQLADAGLQLERNVEGIATSVGGTAENRILVHWAKAAESIKTIDDTYARYYFNKQGRSTLPERLRANTVGQLDRRTKLSKREFKAEIAKAMRKGDESDIPEVAEAAAFIRKTVYDPLFEEAQKLGIYENVKINDEGDVELVGDLTYLNRDYNLEVIKAREVQFVKILADHFQGKLQADFQERLGKLLEKLAADEEMLTDVGRPLEEVARLREEFLNELKQIDESRTAAEEYVEDAIADLRSMAADRSLPEQMRKDARAKAAMMEEREGQKLAGRQEKRKQIKKRLRNLNRSYAMKTEQHGAKLDRIARLEELSLASMNRVVRGAQRFLQKLETASEENFAEELSTLKNRFAAIAKQYDSGEERISKMAADETAQLDELIAADLRQTDRAGRLSDIAEELDTVESIDRDALRALIQEGLDETLKKVNRLNGRRFSRAERLAKQVEELAPEKVQAQIERLTQASLERRAKFIDDWQANGAKPGFKIEAGSRADFDAYSRELAQTVTEKILGTNARLAGHDLIMEPRGAELARVLDIPSEQIEDFLDNDIEHLMSQYIRTLAPDIEIRKKLGEYAPDMGRNLEFQKLNQEKADVKAATTAAMQAKGATPEAIDKANAKIDKQFADVRRDLEAVIGRLRHTWGVPQDPTAAMTRLGRLAMNINVLRYMNMVVNSSIPDIGQPVMKYGLMRTFRSGWVPFIKNIAQAKFTSRELNLLGASIDLVMHSRAMAISDIGDYMVRGSKFEKAVEYISNKIGLIAAFDIWTTAMKQIAGTTANAQILDDIRFVMEGKASKKAIERLAASGIDGDTAQVIWKELQKPGGSEIVNGVLWPNTEAWDNAAGAVDAYRAAILREVNRTIVTPGAERPLMSDRTLAGRLLWQFKSFGMSSTTKTTLAGLQQRDMAVVQGLGVSLAMGALSYYIWANITGGKSLEDMNKAIADGDWGKFADEAISRSGALGILGMGQDVASTIPMVAPYVSLSGERLTRQADNDFIDALGGPTVDLLKRAHAGFGDLENFDRRKAHQIRLMAPFQNHFLLRQAYDAIERAIPE